MSRERIIIPTEEELLDYIEGELSVDQAEALFVRLEGQDKARDGLLKLRADKEALCALQDPDPPADLLDDCLTAVERTLLVADDPIAPVFEFPRRQKGAWRKYAAAASFLLIATVGGFLILRSINFRPVVPEFVANNTERAPDEKNVDVPPEVASGAVSDSNDAGNLDIEGQANLLAANESASVTDRDTPREPTVETSDEGGETEIAAVDHGEGAANRERAERFARVPPLRDHAPIVSVDESDSVAATDMVAAEFDIGSTDPGLGVRLAALERDPALAKLRELVKKNTGTTLIYNTPLRDTLPTNIDPDEFETLNWTSSGNGDSNQPASRSGSPTPPSRSGRPQGQNEERVLDESHFIILPLELQHVYRDEGYEYTLVGRPSQLHAILKEMNSSTEVGAVRVLRRMQTGSESTVNSLTDLMAPARPAGKDLPRAIFWWNDPERNLPIARRLIESLEEEPVVRIPIRIVGR